MLQKLRQPWVIIRIALVIIAISLAFYVQPKKSSIKNIPIPSDSDVQGKEVVQIGVYILRILNFDTSTGTYQIDFFLNLKCQALPCDPTEFEVTNATSHPDIDSQTTEDDEQQGIYYYRVHADMQTVIDVREFPFDVQRLRIELEHKYKSATQYILLPDTQLSGFDSQIEIPGWTALPEIQGRSELHSYSIYGESYSKAILEVLVFNPIWESLLRTVLPVIVITFAGIISFFMKYDRAMDRLGLITSSLVGSVLFSLSFPRGATYMSAFMLANYLILVSGLGLTIRLMTLINEDKVEQAKKLHDVTDDVFLLIWFITQIAFVAYGLNRFYSNF